MITATELPDRYQVRFSDGRHDGVADAATVDGGSDAGFKPHALLEAALATCITMTIRMYADRKGLELPALAARVKLDQSRADAPVMRYDVGFGDAVLTEVQSATLRRVAAACPVHKLLGRSISIERSELFV